MSFTSQPHSIKLYVWPQFTPYIFKSMITYDVPCPFFPLHAMKIVVFLLHFLLLLHRLPSSPYYEPIMHCHASALGQVCCERKINCYKKIFFFSYKFASAVCILNLDIYIIIGKFILSVLSILCPYVHLWCHAGFSTHRPDHSCDIVGLWMDRTETSYFSSPSY